MNAFIGQLKTTCLSPEEIKASGGQAALYQLLEDFAYHSDRFGLITVPAGLITDFASIPRAVKWYIDDDDPVILFPSVVHDYLYGLKGDLGNGVIFSRAQADDVLREAMLLCGARGAQAAVVYGAVRLGGGGHWK